MHNGNGHGNGGKRWLLIGLLILGGFWLVNDAYDDGFRDAMLQTGQGATIRRFHGGPDFPWGLIILGGIGYVAWRKGAFDRLGGPGGPFGDGGGRGIQRYGNGGGYVNGQGPAPAPGAPPQGQGFGPSFRGPRAFFDEWHRESHAAHQAQAQYAPPAPPAPPAGQAYSQTDNGSPAAGVTHTPPPPPPAPDYWASMARASGAAEGASTPGAPFSPPPAPEARPDENAGGPRDAAGAAPERW